MSDTATLMHKAQTLIELHVENALNRARDLLIEHGATPAELETELQHQWNELLDWRDEALDEVRAAINDDAR